MKLIILLIYTPFVYTELHSFITTYTGVTGIEGKPEFFAVSTLDGQELDYYDSETQTLIPKQTWLQEYAFTDMWKQDFFIREQVKQIYKMNIIELMSRFNQSNGIHTYQRMYGCIWDSETEESDGFDEYSYDGEDFIALDLKNDRYITTLPEGILTMVKWNNNLAQIEDLRQYYTYDCVYWIKFFLNLRKDALKNTAPEVSLLQKDPSAVSCHATGFYPSEVRIYWMRNGQDHNEDVVLSATLPNVDGTFQKTSRLSVRPEDWSKEQYVCVVEHQSLTEKIQKILSEDEINRNARPAKLYFVILSMMMMMMMMMIILIIFLIRLSTIKQRKGQFKEFPCPKMAEICQNTANIKTE